MEPPPESQAEALGRMALPVGFIVWGIVLLRRAARRERESEMETPGSEL
jgi:cytochrome c-type biogenesis protein CcmH/NrfF